MCCSVCCSVYVVIPLFTFKRDTETAETETSFSSHVSNSLKFQEKRSTTTSRHPLCFFPFSILPFILDIGFTTWVQIQMRFGERRNSLCFLALHYPPCLHFHFFLSTRLIGSSFNMIFRNNSMLGRCVRNWVCLTPAHTRTHA